MEGLNAAPFHRNHLHNLLENNMRRVVGYNSLVQDGAGLQLHAEGQGHRVRLAQKLECNRSCLVRLSFVWVDSHAVEMQGACLLMSIPDSPERPRNGADRIPPFPELDR